MNLARPDRSQRGSREKQGQTPTPGWVGRRSFPSVSLARRFGLDVEAKINDDILRTPIVIPINITEF